MSIKYVNDIQLNADLKSIADAIRTKGSTSASLSFPTGFISAIGDISGGAIVDPLSVSANGTYSAPTGHAYDPVTVNVPTGGGGDLTTLEKVMDGTYSGALIGDSAAVTIKDNFFQHCAFLTSVSFPAVTSIGNYAFQDCPSLTSVSFPSATSIGAYAFWSCYFLTSVSFPVVTSINANAFRNCSRLTSVSFPSATSIGSFAFYYCGLLTSVNCPAVTTISNNAFQNCSSLTSVSFPVVTTINSNAFNSCRSLTSVSFPAVISIGSSAFNSCSNLASIYIGLNVSSIAKLYPNVFANTPMSNSSYLGYFGSIYVPASLVDSYKSATNWTAYSDRITAYTG